MGNGIRLVDYYLSEALRLRGESQIEVHLNLANKVLTWLHEMWPHNAVYPAAIYNHPPIRAVRNQAQARKVISTLVDHGHLIKIDDSSVVDGKHRREAWRIVGKDEQ